MHLQQFYPNVIHPEGLALQKAFDKKNSHGIGHLPHPGRI